jgi:hypothetical protein
MPMCGFSAVCVLVNIINVLTMTGGFFWEDGLGLLGALAVPGWEIIDLVDTWFMYSEDSCPVGTAVLTAPVSAPISPGVPVLVAPVLPGRVPNPLSLFVGYLVAVSHVASP